MQKMMNRLKKGSFQCFAIIICFGIFSLVKAQPTHPHQTGLAGAGIDRNNLPVSSQMIFTTADNGRVISDVRFDGQVKLDGTEGLTFIRCWFQSNGSLAAISDKYGDNPRNSTFEDCDFGAHGYDQWASSANIINMSGTNHFRRCLIYNSADGIKFENKSVNYLEDCWIQPVARGDKHTDCTQLNDKHVAEIYFTRCTFEKRTWTFDGQVAHSMEELEHPDATLSETTHWGNATLQSKPCNKAGACTGPLPGAYYSFESCIVIGGNYIVTAEKQPGRFVNNVVIRGSSNGKISALREIVNFDDISGNIYHDDGAVFNGENLGQNMTPTPIPFLNIVGMVTDEEEPTVPGPPVAGYIGDQSIELSWDASTDNIGVIYYNVYINGAEHERTSGNSTIISGLLPATEYEFTVSAFDAGGNESQKSPALTVSTSAASSGSEGLIKVAVITSSNNDPADEAEVMDDDINTRWTSDGDGKWIAFEFDGTYIINSIGIAFYKGDERSAIFDIQVSADGETWTTIFNGTSNGQSLGIELFDLPNTEGNHLRYLGHGNTTSTWNALTELDIYGSVVDNEVPRIPTALTASNISASSVDLSWEASNDNNTVTGYWLYTDGKNPIMIAGTSTTLSDLSASTEYNFTVSAIDAEGNESGQSAAITVTTLDDNIVTPDIEAPSIPTALTASNITSSSIGLSWDAATDNVAVTGYKLYINHANPVSITGTRITLSDLPSSTEYIFTVSTIDAEGNESVQSSEIVVATLDNVTEISDGNEMKLNLRIYPNPVDKNHFLVLLNTSGMDEKVTIKIIGLSGRIVYQTQIANFTTGEYRLDINDHEFNEKGIYLVTATSQYYIKQLKLVVQ